jgi:hypothetical protein
VSDKPAGLYMYAIVAAERGSALPAPSVSGIGGSEVYAICEGELAAVVSRTQQERLRPERRHLGAHQAVLKMLTRDDTALPMSFGIIASSETAVRKILHKHRDMFLAQLGRVTGKVEMGLRVLWDVSNIFEYFVGRFAELQTARNALLESHPGNRDRMIALGQMFEARLNDEREHAFKRVADVLGRHGVEVKRNPPRSEREVMNLACLVKRELQNEFEGVVCEAARGFDNSFLFDFNGPWSPHNFVDLKLAQAD